MRNKTEIILTLLILLGFGALNTFAQDEPYMEIGGGHTGSVFSVAFHPDGDTLASGSEDDTIRLWDTSTGENLKTLEGHTSSVFSVAFHPDGDTLASGSEDDTIRLWDTSTGENLKTLEGHTDFVTSVAFHPGGDTLASAGGYDDGTIRLWDVNTGENLKTLEGHAGGVWSVAFHPDGDTLASGGHDGTIKLWDANTGEHLKTLEGHMYAVYSVAFHPGGGTLASGGHDRTIRLWDANTGENLKTLEGHTDGVRSVAFHPDGNTLASGSWDINVPSGNMRLWEVNTGKELKTHTGYTGVVYSVAFSPEGHILVSGGLDATIRLWHVDTAGVTPNLPITIVAPPDLQFTKVWASPATVAPGKEFKLSATVSNPGGNSDSTVLWWHGPSEDDPTLHTELKANRIPPLPLPDGKTEVTKHITLTAPETSGIYTYRASIDTVEGEKAIPNTYAFNVNDTVSRVLKDHSFPDTPGIYYYGVCIDTVAGETDPGNNCKFIKVIVSGTRLEIPEDLISDVAFTPNHTYFVLNPQFLSTVGNSLENNHVRHKCLITLHLGRLHLDGTSDYYMLSLPPNVRKSELEQVEDIAEDIGETLVLHIIGKVPIGKLKVSELLKIGKALFSFGEISDPEEHPKATIAYYPNETFGTTTGGDIAAILFIIKNKRLSSVGFDVTQDYYHKDAWVPIDIDLKTEPVNERFGWLPGFLRKPLVVTASVVVGGTNVIWGTAEALIENASNLTRSIQRHGYRINSPNLRMLH